MKWFLRQGIPLCLVFLGGIVVGRQWARTGEANEGDAVRGTERASYARVFTGESSVSRSRDASRKGTGEGSRRASENINWDALRVMGRVPGEDLFGKEDVTNALLSLTDEEKVFLIEGWEAAQDALKLTESRSSSHQWNEGDTEVQIKVPPLGVERAKIRESFAKTVNKVLGPERARVFLAMKGGEEMFGSGDEEQSYIIAAESVGDGTDRFRITRQVGETRSQWVADAIPPKFRHLTDGAGIDFRLYDPASEGGCR